MMNSIRRSKISILLAGLFGALVAITPTVANAQFRDQLKREVTEAQGVANNVGDTAKNTKEMAAKVEQTAAKTKATAARVEGVANVTSKGLGLLANKIYFNTDESEEFLVQEVLEKALRAEGIEVVNDDGPAVCNFRVYIGVDDADDDDDGTPDAADKDDFGDMDEVVGEKNADLPDTQIIEHDLDKEDPELTATLPDTTKDQGIYIVLVSDNPDQVLVFRMDADSFSSVGGGGDSASTFAAHASPHRPGAGWGALFGKVVEVGTKAMSWLRTR